MEFTIGAVANLIYRGSEDKWFRLQVTPHHRDFSRVLESIRSELAAVRPLSVTETHFHGEKDSQQVVHKSVKWQDGRVTDATLMVELSKEPAFEFQRVTKYGKLLSLLHAHNRADARSAQMAYRGPAHRVPRHREGVARSLRRNPLPRHHPLRPAWVEISTLQSLGVAPAVMWAKRLDHP